MAKVGPPGPPLFAGFRGVAFGDLRPEKGFLDRRVSGSLDRG